MIEGSDSAGLGLIIGSRLVDSEALSGNLPAVKTALQGSIPPEMNAFGMVNFVSWKGHWDAVAAGDR